jgi:tetratricopeptide (TPR) repeat protein
MSAKYTNNLPDDLNQKRRDFTDQGSRFQMGHKNLKAVDSYLKAYEFLPEPKDQWNCTPSILRGVAENYYLKAFFDSKSEEESRKYYLLSLQYFEEYMKNPDNIGFAVNHGQIGRIWYELGNFDNAKEELIRAYMAEGKEWFDDLNPKYYELIRPIVEKS